MNINHSVLLDTGIYIGKEVNQRIFDGIITSETGYETDFISDWHFHKNPHFSHILNGGSREIRENGFEQQRSGSSLYYYPGIVHQNIAYLPNTRIFNLEFAVSFLTRYGINMPAESWMFSDTYWNRNDLIRIMAEHYLNDQVSPVSIHQLAISLLSTTKTPYISKAGWPKRLKDMLHDNWNSSLSLMDISTEIDLHPVTISRYFPHYFGCTLGDYLRWLKIEKAQLMIRLKKHSLTEIAYYCGFVDQAHFTKTYKRFFGITPKQYQKL